MAKTPHAAFPLGSCRFYIYFSNKDPICPLKTNYSSITRYSHKRRREQDQRKVGRMSRPVEI
jgi:hypothetical protein